MTRYLPLLSRLSFSHFSGLALSLAAGLLSAPVSAADESIAPPAAADVAAPWRVALRLTPPLLRGFSTGNIGFGGVALAVTAPVGVFVEASAHALVGSQGLGHEASVGAGYVIHDRPRPGEWHFSLPVQLGWRHANRPVTSPSDGYALTEKLDLVAVTLRPMMTRTWQSNALELGLTAGAGVPFSRRGPAEYASYYSDGETRVWLDVSAFVGFSFGL